MNVLYVTPYVPSRIRTRPYHLIRALVRLGHQVTLLTAAGNSPEEQEQSAELRSWGMRVEVFPVSLVRSLVNCLRALPTAEPLQAVYAYHPEMEKRLGELLNEETIDVVHIEHLRAARLVRAVNPPSLPSQKRPASGKVVRRVPVVYDSVDCISLLFEQASQIGAQLRSRLMTTVDLARTRRYEALLLTRYDHVVVTSQRDKDALEGLARRYLPRLAPGGSPHPRSPAHAAPITVITCGVDLEYFRPLPAPMGSPHPRFHGKTHGRPPTVVFTGKMSYHANVAAALYFAQDVLPLIWAQDPEVRFQIVGKDPPDAIRQLAIDARVQVTGTVDDLRPYLTQATVAVCPALYAVGVQNKVLEAMACGTPVVSTPAGCAALEVAQDQEILVASDEEELATAVLRVISDPALATRLSTAGRRYVEIYHSWEAMAQQLVGIYRDFATSER